MRAVTWAEIPDEQLRPGVRARAAGLPGSAGARRARAAGLGARALAGVGGLSSGELAGLWAALAPLGSPLAVRSSVARECGLPAVVGAERATAVIPDGALVRGDGSSGEVQILRGSAGEVLRGSAGEVLRGTAALDTPATVCVMYSEGAGHWWPGTES